MSEIARIKKYFPLMNDLYVTARESLGFEPHVKIVILKNEDNMSKPLGKTAHYSPAEHKIALYTQGRHIKDILRSLSHELVHHNQNCRGDFDGGAATTQGYAQEDGHLREMEREAYEVGNMIFRDWEDNLKNKGGKPLFTSTQPYVRPMMTNVVGSRIVEGEKMKDKMNESNLRDIIRGVIQEMFNDDMSEGVDSEKDDAAELQGMAAEEEAQKASGQEGAVYKGVSEGHDYDTKGTPLEDPKDPENPERYEKGKVGNEVFEDSGEEEKELYETDRASDEEHIEAIRGHLDALEHDKSYDEEHEDFHESFFPKGRSLREKARMELNEALMKRWNNIIK